MNHKLQAIDMQGNKMINRFSNIMCRLVLAAVFVVVGCEQEHKEDASVYEVLLDPNFVMPEYASRAIEATGGRQAWRNKKKLELDCVVTLYKPPRLLVEDKSGGSFYLTEQHHEIYSVQGPDFQPPLNSIRISALEPQGKFVWQLSGELFSVLEGAEQVGALPIMANRYFAEAILNITTAPVRFLDKSFAFTKGTKPVKIEGQWYEPIEREKILREKILVDDIADLPYWPKVVFYQNTGTARVDMLWFVAADEKKFLAARGYDYKEVEKGSILVPTKIEIFRADANSVMLKRLVKIDYYRLRAAE